MIRLAILVALLGSDTAAWAVSTADTGTAPPTDTSADTDTAAEPDPDTSDTGAPVDPGLDLDGDLDGFTPRGGDCDDANRDAHPGVLEVCEDRVDNDCDGLFDEGCDDAIRLATIRGGGGCTSGSGVAGTEGALVLLPFTLLVLLVGWRRR